MPSDINHLPRNFQSIARAEYWEITIKRVSRSLFHPRSHYRAEATGFVKVEGGGFQGVAFVGDPFASESPRFYSATADGVEWDIRHYVCQVIAGHAKWKKQKESTEEVKGFHADEICPEPHPEGDY